MTGPIPTTEHRDVPDPTSDIRPTVGVLAVPDGWAVADITRERLAATLATAPQDVVGVVAARADLPSGASWRVVAERRALRPTTDTAATGETVVEGAVLLHPGVAHEIGVDSVTVERDGLLIDHGAIAHDPWRPLPELASASPEGRPPFPYRPVVVFLGLEEDPDLADWVRRTVNDLVTLSTEARIAVPAPTAGLHLTRPCSPTPASIEALAPDVVVALDDAALDAADRWLAADRSAVVIEMTPDTTGEVELVPWRIGHAEGRVRARIGRGIVAPDLERLARRLSSGPQVLPPVDERAPRLRIRRHRRSSESTTSVTALLGAASANDRSRYEAFADHAPAGLDLTVRSVGGRDPIDDEGAEVVLLRGLSHSPAARALVDQRRRGGLATVVDLELRDLRLEGGRPPRTVALAPEAMQLARACGAALTVNPLVQDWLTGRGVRTLVLPTLWRRDRYADLVHLRAQRPPAGRPVVGWHTGTGTLAPDAEGAVPTSVLTALLDAHPEVVVEVVGDRLSPMESFRSHPRVTFVPGQPEPDLVGRWRAHIWSAPTHRTELDGDFRTVVEATLLGVPTCTAPATPPWREGLVPAGLVIAGHDDWRRVERILTDDVEHRRWVDEVARRADALYGPESSTAILERLLGWLLFGPPT